MTRKAKLDILEILPEEQEAVLPEEREPEIPPPQPSVRLRKKFLVPAVIFFVVCCLAGSGIVFWLRSGQRAAPPPDRRAAPTVIAGERQNMVTLTDFFVDYREPGDRVRIAVFALAVELDESVRKDTFEKQPELRGDIYRVSKKRSLAALRSPDERGALRSEIAAALEKRLGAGSVKAVYFTKFYIM